MLNWAHRVAQMLLLSFRQSNRDGKTHQSDSNSAHWLVAATTTTTTTTVTTNMTTMKATLPESPPSLSSRTRPARWPMDVGGGGRAASLLRLAVCLCAFRRAGSSSCVQPALASRLIWRPATTRGPSGAAGRQQANTWRRRRTAVCRLQLVRHCTWCARDKHNLCGVPVCLGSPLRSRACLSACLFDGSLLSRIERASEPNEPTNDDNDDDAFKLQLATNLQCLRLAAAAAAA